MVALVTGGTGFIGRKLVDALCQEGHRVRVISRHGLKICNRSLEGVEGDLLAEDFPFNEVLKDCSVVFHCAGEIRNEELMFKLHVDATERLIRATLQEAKRTNNAIHWVQLSSVGVYGPNHEGVSAERLVTEETTVNPVGIYEKSKAQSDELVVQANENPLFTYSILRPSNVFGIGMPNGSLRQLGRMVNKGLFFFIGKPNAIAPYVHVDDVVAVMLLSATDSKAKGEIFNLSNDCLLEEMIEAIAQQYNKSVPIIRVPEKIVRVLVDSIGKFIPLPLSNDRIDALVSRTKYPNLKLKRLLKISPKISVISSIGEVVRNEEWEKEGR